MPDDRVKAITDFRLRNAGEGDGTRLLREDREKMRAQWENLSHPLRPHRG